MGPYQFNFGNDPLLSNSNQFMNYEQEIEDRMRQLQVVKEQFAQNKQIQSQNSTSLWNDIDKEISSLNDDQRNILFSSEEYINIDNELKILIQEVLINSAKGTVENSKQGKELLDKQLNFIKNNKKSIVDQSNKDIELFKKFQIASKANPQLTYPEFIKTITQ